MKSASNGDVLKGCLQVLHVVDPLGISYIAKPDTDQHESRVAVQNTTHRTSAAMNFSVQPPNDVVRADTSPMVARKIVVGWRFFNTILNLFMERSSSTTARVLKNS